MELEITSKEMSAELRDLYFLSAKEVEAPGGKTALIIFVPFRQHKKFQKLQSRLIRELEKKFSGKHVVLIAQRTILSPNFARSHPGQLRPRSRTLTAVHSAVLEDIVYPTQIVGRRTRFRADGTRLLKVYVSRQRSSSETTDGPGECAEACGTERRKDSRRLANGTVAGPDCVSERLRKRAEDCALPGVASSRFCRRTALPLHLRSQLFFLS
jgi:small subunit ribosomal protein S7e